MEIGGADFLGKQLCNHSTPAVGSVESSIMAMTPRFDLSGNSRNRSASRTIRIDPAVNAASPDEQMIVPMSVESTTIPQDLHEVERLLRDDHYIPETYEENYSYPLLIWITQPGQEFDLSATMDAVSDRNYLGLQFELDQVFHPMKDPDAFVRQLQVHELGLHKALRSAVSQFRHQYKVHSERIYLAGVGQGAVAALHLGLARPEWFGGVISIDAGTDQIPQLLRRYRHLQGERVLLAHSRGATETSRQSELKLARMLFTAGLRVCRRAYTTTELRTRRGRAPDLYRDIDRWVMQEIAQAQLT